LAAAERIEGCLQREMAYGLGVEVAARVVDELIAPILAARASGNDGVALDKGR